MTREGIEKEPRAENYTVIDGEVVEPVEHRFTPSGKSVLMFLLEHLSEGDEALGRVHLRISVSIFGMLADVWSRSVKPGMRLQVSGYLNQRRWIRDDETRWGKIELHARKIVALPDPNALPSHDENTVAPSGG
ncbi:MAG: single-stranded DNA-binding protein [Magnetococcales bacterium]|nr:single-stranded DNA-binding protein [Magnetococcales bacterium]